LNTIDNSRVDYSAEAVGRQHLRSQLLAVECIAHRRASSPVYHRVCDKLGAGSVQCVNDAATDVATLFATLTGTDVRPFSGCTEKDPLEGNERLQISNLFLPASVTEEVGKRMNQSHRSEGRVPQRVKHPQRESLSVIGLRV
jgi:hypothetical protein